MHISYFHPISRDPYLASYFQIELNRFLLDEPSVCKTTLAKVKNIQERTVMELVLFDDTLWNSLFEHNRKYQFRDQLRRLIHVISKNENIVQLMIFDRSRFRIPGSIIAEWLGKNNYVSRFCYAFYDDESDFDLLCTAIQQNTTVASFYIAAMQLQGPKIKMLGRAFRDSRGIVEVEFNCMDESANYRNANADAEIIFLKEMLGPKSHIKRLVLDIREKADESAIGDIISGNKSLTSFKINGPYKQMPQVLHGVSSSVGYGVITDFELSTREGLLGMVAEEIQMQEQSLLFEMIGKMKNLKCVRFSLYDFESLSADYIDTNLRTIRSLDCLVITGIAANMGLNIDLLKRISTWKRKCKVHIEIAYNLDANCIPYISNIFSTLEDVLLERLKVNVDPDLNVKLSDIIPKWKFLKELEVDMYFATIYTSDDIVKARQMEFAAAVRKNDSLERVLVNLKFPHTLQLHSDAKMIIDKALARNTVLVASIVTPTSVPDWMWPNLLEMADKDGLLDYSFQMMPYLFSRFIEGRQVQDD